MVFYYNDGEIYTDDCSVKWTIRNIFWFPQTVNVEICSPKFCVAEVTWRLRAFPWGRKVPKFENTPGWFGVALCACGPVNVLDDKPFSIRFSITGKSGEVSNSEPDRRRRWYVTDKLLKSRELKSRKEEIAPDDVLTIVCEIHNQELEKSETKSDESEIVYGYKADKIVYEKVSIRKESEHFNSETCVSQSYRQASTSQGGDSNDPSVPENCRKYNDDDCSTVSSDTETESDYCTVASDDTETESDDNTVCEEGEEQAKANCKNTSNAAEQLSALPKGVAKALQDYKELLLSETHSNITIKVRNKEFKAHKGILAARNPVFEAMLKHNMKEKATGVVTIEDIDPKVFPDFLEYLYTGQVQNLCSDNVLGLFAAANMYQIKELREECFMYMKENLSVETFCGILSLSLRHHEKELIALATQFFIENAVDIVKTPKWQIFMTENAVAANELFIRQLEFNKRNQK